MSLVTRPKVTNMAQSSNQQIDFNTIPVDTFFSKEALEKKNSAAKRRHDMMKQLQGTDVVGIITPATFQKETVGGIATRLIEWKHSQGSKAEVSTILKDDLGRIRTFLCKDYKVPNADHIEKMFIQYRDDLAGSDHRKKGEFSTKEKEVIGEKDLRFFFETIEADREEKAKILDQVEVTPDERLQVMFAMVGSALCYENCRLTPLCTLKDAYGISHLDNLISVENHDLGKVTFIFNKMKRDTQAPVHHCLQDPLKTMFRRYYNRFRKSQEDHGFFFETVRKQPFTPDYFQKRMNEYLRSLFPDNQITTRMVRIIETMLALENAEALTYEQYSYLAFLRGHGKNEADLYNRTAETTAAGNKRIRIEN